jgi:aspartyl aminopeptidase
MESQILSNATKFISFLNKSPTPFHVVESARQLLVNAGFTELKLTDRWQTQPRGKYFTTKNESTIIAFRVGAQFKPDSGAFAVVGAHTDSPCLKLKLNSRRERLDYLQVGVECYGGGIWASWFDRDLTVAGRVLVKNKDTSQIETRLVHISRPILKIPHLAIHLCREINDKFGPNKETQLNPILSTIVQENAYFKSNARPAESATAKSSHQREQHEKHHPLLVDLIRKELNLDSASEIYDLELSLVDTQPAQIGGACNEFIFGARLDNQVGSFCTLLGLIQSCEDTAENGDDDVIRMAALYDHEEIGSESATGAASALTEHVMRRLVQGGASGAFELAMTKSFLISADQVKSLSCIFFFVKNNKIYMVFW